MNKNNNNNELRVTLLKADNLVLKDQRDTCDPFVNLFIGSQKSKSKPKKRTSTPVWNEKMESFKSFDLMHPLKVSLKDQGNLIAAKERIGAGYVKLEQLPQSYTITKKVNVYNDEWNSGGAPTGSVYLQLEAVNFGINARMYLTHIHVNRYIKAFHSENDPMTQCIVIRHTGQFFLNLEEAILCLKALLHRDATVDPCLIIFPGDYMVRDTLDLDIKDMVLFGVPSMHTATNTGANNLSMDNTIVTSSGNINIHTFNKKKPLFNVKRQCILHKVHILGDLCLDIATSRQADEFCQVDSSTITGTVTKSSTSIMDIKYTNYDLSGAVDEEEYSSFK